MKKWIIIKKSLCLDVRKIRSYYQINKKRFLEQAKQHY